MAYYRSTILVSMDPICIEKGAIQIKEQIIEELKLQKIQDEVEILDIPRIGDPETEGPDILVYPEGSHYIALTTESVRPLVVEHFIKGRELKQYSARMRDLMDEEVREPKEKEVRVILENIGKIDPRNIEDYIAVDGYQALAKVLTEMTPQEVIQTILDSKLRGRGGAGFPAGLKWKFAHQAPGSPKYMVCNADEGDPGAFMNRKVLEGDPHSVIEGMVIGAYAVGSNQGYVYCRAEYPIAVSTLNIAIKQAKEYGLLGKNIMGTDFTFDLEVRMGAGAFVCGEETALIASIEGSRGEPRVRPPFPATKGLWGKPTNINNVETYANVPKIIHRGLDWYTSLGSEKSKGTKTFALAGDVSHTGLIEVPFGMTLREIIFDIGGGIKGGKGYKAVQTGGPMGGCLPTKYLDLAVDYETLGAAGSIMGSGGMVVMDEDTCMVDIARFFMEFTQEESCGKCVPCRVGTRRILEILERICAGEGIPEDIPMLRSLCDEIKQDSLCGLGQGAPNPVVSTLTHFLDEYEAHIYEKRCPAKVCRNLISYHITDNCTGCTVCARNCPVSAITGERKLLHVIDQDVCIRCGICYQVCNFDAVEVN
ncbi:MAG: NADH-ubiquinone oxidoreductase-F iron-sulfur binding region domain-containing protein [Anaerolineaceae bacterium]|nr:NADH-ubiquinone oxidoreductase-F iron-sulfur binding region domain-containing protein [Anaerolineaceae bacterium]MDD4042201.1 NADH-ubiquinone oxidoreductase-F iron-sulfur binding region domain-containing protein [Anaerolineaceae bacterium]MDD4577037.1 NADH-ubiquinone oxidoreductase-F iron-sulfur binding region domain-containing protein [Anaerolineaceae bacterium]